MVGELNLFPMQCLYYKEEGVYLQEKGQVKEFIPVVSSVPNMANIKEERSQILTAFEMLSMHTLFTTSFGPEMLSS